MNNYAVSKTGEIESRGLYIQPCVLYISLVSIVGIAIIAIVISRFNDLFRKHALLKIHNTEMSEQLASLKVAESEMAEKLSVLKTQIENLIQTNAESSARMSEKMAQLNITDDEMATKLALLQMVDQEMSDQLDSLKLSDTAMTEKLEVLKTQIATLTQTNAESSSRMSEQLKMADQEMANQLVSIKTTNKDMTKLLGELDDDIQELAQTVESIVENNEITAKIQHTVSNITKYFEFFAKLSEYIGEERFRRIFVRSSLPQKSLFEQYATAVDIGLKCQQNFDPFVHTPILMKHFSKYYNKTHDRFYPLFCKAYAGVGENSHKRYREIMVASTPGISHPNIFTATVEDISIGGSWFKSYKHNCPPDFALLNRSITRLLHETAEEFELKFLKKILNELEEIYVFYKQYEMIGIKKGLDLPDEFDSM